jgi:hypothetical protein
MITIPYRSRLWAFVNRVAFAVLVLLAVGALGRVASGQTDPTLTELHRSFADPPDSSKIMMRWWWFGPAVNKNELRLELEQMKDAGIGGVEIANLYPLALDDPATGFRNTPFSRRST